MQDEGGIRVVCWTSMLTIILSRLVLPLLHCNYVSPVQLLNTR